MQRLNQYVKLELKTYSHNNITITVADRFNELVDIFNRMGNDTTQKGNWKAIEFVETLIETNRRILSLLMLCR